MEYAEECATRGSKPSARGVTLSAIMSADRIGWSASANSKSIGRHITSNRLAGHFPEIEATPVDALSTRFVNRKKLVAAARNAPHAFRYNHPSVAEGPWPVGRLCPAVPWQMPLADGLASIERFDRYLTAFERRDWPDHLKDAPQELDGSLFSRVTLLLQIGAVVGHETIFKEWVQSESQNSHLNHNCGSCSRRSVF